MKTQERLERLIKEREENTKIIKEFQKNQKRLSNAISQARNYIRKQENKKKI